MKNTTLFFFINMFSAMGYSLVSPLFPSLGKEDNLNEGILGLIISTYSIASTIITPFIPALSKKFSRTKLLCFSTFFEATCTLLYGFLSFVHLRPLLLTIIFSLRILHGCCSAIIGTLIYSLTISLSEENETQLSLGNLELGWSFGTSIGPLFASFFYKIGGYSMPFIVLGLFLYISVWLAKSVHSEKLNKEEESEENPPFASFLFYPQIFLILTSFTMGMINVTFYFPCLTNHLMNNYNLSVSMASLFFIIPIITYITILQFLDKLSAKLGIYLIFIFGIIFSTISPIFLCPCPPIPKSLIAIIVGFLIIGLGSGPVFIPGLVLLAKNIRKIDQNIDELTANDIASALNTLTLAVGDFTGPIIGGFFTFRFNFKICCYIIFALGTINAGIFIFYFFDSIKDNINSFLSKEIKVSEKKEKLFKIKEEIYGDNDNDNLNKSALLLNNSIFQKFKFESFSLRGNHFANKFRKKENQPKLSLYSSLTN